MQVDNLDDFIKSQETESARPLLLAIRNMLNDQLRWADTIGRMDENEFLLILPETHLEATGPMIDLIRKRFDDLYIEGVENSDFKVQARFGVAEGMMWVYSWPGPEKYWKKLRNKLPEK